MGDLIDFGKFAQTAIAFQTMQQNQQRMGLMEENNAIDRQRLADAQQARDQAWKTNQIALGTKLVDDPTVSLPDKARVYQFIAGVAGFPDLNPSQLMSAGDTLKQIGDAVTKNDLPRRDQLVMELSYRFPKLALDQLNVIEKTQGLNEKALEHKQKLEMGQVKLQQIEEQSAALKSAHEVYAPLSGEYRGILQTFGTPGVRLYSGEFSSEGARNAFLAMNPDTKRVVDASTDKRILSRHLQLEAEKELAYWKAQQEAIDRGESTQNPEVVKERVVAYQKAVNARQSEYDFFADLSDMKMGRGKGLDKAKYEAFVQAQRDLEESAKVSQKGLKTLGDERLAFMETKADKKELQDTAQNFGNVEFLRAVQSGMDPTSAAIAGVEAAHKKYGVMPDSAKFADPSKKGQQTIQIKMGQEDFSRQFKAIESAQGVLDFTKDLSDRIKANPRIVGPGAQLSTAVAGSTQQLRALLNMDPSAAQFLNTKTRDEAESFHELLVYLQAKSMDPVGAMNKETIVDARKVIGDLSSFSTGPQQLLNKLDVVGINAERNIRRGRSHIQGGVKSYMTDPKKPVGEMTEEELMRSILQGTVPP